MCVWSWSSYKRAIEHHTVHHTKQRGELKTRQSTHLPQSIINNNNNVGFKSAISQTQSLSTSCFTSKYKTNLKMHAQYYTTLKLHIDKIPSFKILAFTATMNSLKDIYLLHFFEHAWYIRVSMNSNVDMGSLTWAFDGKWIRMHTSVR